MKHSISIIGLALIVSLIISCKPNKVEPVVKRVYKEYKAVTETDAYRYYQNQRRLNTFHNLMQNYSKCNTCNGYGIVYKQDLTGNYYGQYDMYGNFWPTIFTCPACGGSGSE